MIQKICILAILFSTVVVCGQNITLLKNNHPKAKELKHHLNTTKDSLLLACEKTIIQVDIFNEDYENILIVEDSSAQISLNEVPAGEFFVEVKLADKIIVMNLIKPDHIDNLTESKVGHSKNYDHKTSSKSIAYLLTGGKRENTTSKRQKFYWTITKVNNGKITSKTMKLVDKETADRMISKNKLEQNSISGKLNELSVWEVYDTKKFMELQVSNPDFIYSAKSAIFNTNPYYRTETSIQTL
jgi:hypothetical protein